MAITNPRLYAVVPRTRPTPASHKRTVVSVRQEKSAETRAKEVIDRAHGVLTKLEGRVDSFTKEIARLQKRKALAQARIERFEGECIQRLEKAALQKADGFHITLKISPCPPSVDVFNEAAIPKHYLREKTTWTPNKTAIREAIEAEIDVPGARLVQNISLHRK